MEILFFESVAKEILHVTNCYFSRDKLLLLCLFVDTSRVEIPFAPMPR